MKKNVTFYLSLKTIDLLKKLAKETDRSQSKLIEHLVKTHKIMSWITEEK